MLFETAVLIFVVCAAGTAVFFSLHRRNRRKLFIVLSFVSASLSIASLVYCILTLFFAAAAQH